MDKIMKGYCSFIKSSIKINTKSEDRDLHYWQDQLFYNFLIYCLPVSLVALIPGVYMAIQDGFPIIAAVDLICFLLVTMVTFSSKLSMTARKLSIISIFYFLSIFLINSLGYLGPGIFYLFFVTVLIALIFPIRYAYWSVFSNAAILLFFTAIIRFKLFNSALISEYTPGKWIAFSGNLIFASIVIVILIDKIFDGLQQTVIKQGQLQERYKSIFDKSPLPMWLFDTETLKFLDVNEAAIRHYGYSKPEFLSMTIKDIRPLLSIPEVEDIVKVNKISGTYYDGNSQHLKKSGEIIYVKIESNLMQFGERSARLVLSTDITKQVEHQLEINSYNLRIKDSESNLRAIFESALDGFVLLDANFRIKVFNTKASESMRFNKNQSVFETGRSIFDYIDTQRLAYFKEIITQVFSGQTIDYARRYRGADGSKTWIRYTLTPVWEGNAVIGVCINGRDVTVKKLYLKNLEDQNKTFREISWMQSHLVRAPLARIMGLMPLFKNAINEEEKTEVVEYMTISAKELDDIIFKISNKSHRIIKNYQAQDSSFP